MRMAANVRSMATPRRGYGEALDLVPIQGKVPEAVRDMSRRRAKELSLSQAQYLELLIRADHEHHFVESPFEQEELDQVG